MNKVRERQSGGDREEARDKGRQRERERERK